MKAQRLPARHPRGLTRGAIRLARLTQPFAKRWIAAAGNDGRGARLLRGVLVLAAILAREGFLGGEAGVLPDRGLALGGDVGVCPAGGPGVRAGPCRA